MKRILGAATAAAIVAVLGACTGAVPAAAQQDFHWSGRIAAGERIQINNLVGDIHAEPTSGDQVVVTATRTGRDADRVRIEVVHRGTGTVVCAIYPGQSRGWNDDDDGDDRGPRDACNQRSSTGMHDTDARVDFTVRVPAGVRLAANTVSGDVDARSLSGPVAAHSVSGNVRVSTSGPVEAATVSGNVVATLGRTAGHDLSFRSVSGDVTLQVPAGFDADFEAETLSGSIESDFPLHRERDDDDRGGFHVHVGHQARGTLGRGGNALRVNTVSGDVTLRRIR